MKLRRQRIPPDGDCMFGAVLAGLRTFDPSAWAISVSSMRDRLSRYVRNHYDENVNGMTLREWTLAECGLNVHEYCNTMQKNRYDDNSWGGQLELLLCARLYDVTIEQYNVSISAKRVRARGRSRRTRGRSRVSLVSKWIPDGGGGGPCGGRRRVVRLLYTPGHYDLLVQT